MNRILASLLLAVLGAALWLLWNLEHEHTRIRAPWTGLTQVASAIAFVAPLVAMAEPPLEPGYGSGCDPGCISGPPLYVLAGMAGAVLSTVGILLRRTVAVVSARVHRPSVE